MPRARIATIVGARSPGRPAPLVAGNSAPEPAARSPGPAAANDASDPAAAGPIAADDPAVTRLVLDWCQAYSRWGIDPHGGAARVLRSLSTPGLYAALAAEPPAATAARPGPVTVLRARAFRMAQGYDAIVDLRSDGADLAIELTIVIAAHGPLVGALSL